MGKHQQDAIEAAITTAIAAIKDLPPEKQVEIMTSMSFLDREVLQSESFVTWANLPEMVPLLEDQGLKIKAFDGHAVALGKGGEQLYECSSRAATLRELFSSIGWAMEISIKSGKVDGASIAVYVNVK